MGILHEEERIPLRPTVLVVDMQEKFVRHLDKSQLEELVKEQIKVIRFSREMDVPCVVIELTHFGATLPVIAQEALLVPRNCTLYKTTNSAFHATGLDVLLQHYRANACIILGINKSACVHSTAVDGDEIGYLMYTSSTIIADGKRITQSPQRQQHMHDAHEWMIANTVYHVSTEEMLDAIREEMLSPA